VRAVPRTAAPVMAGRRRSGGHARPCWLAGSPRRLRTRPLSVARLTDLHGSISERARRWGILPAYHGWQGEVVETAPAVEVAILDAMGATPDTPPPLPESPLPQERCVEAPERVWGWAIQL